ncbi:MAG TPA: type II secretion system F family protein [Thermotogota bacterium]|jgi:type IV pilus assembly protein PilC|nr:type II secretion system F family protein [Thermotogota bacterium]NLH20456.1 type II secretion system F family protein [Thermotogaceae bacterium]OQC30270.1 MAG: Type II secretion system protein F [Thermotogota bacterium ADurb.Bin062]HNW47296.1 type II secretion system F family protein [Thermotogota bacterium]HNY82250.1 type II secretion system F family protein [Thermotogota bacterium]
MPNYSYRATDSSGNRITGVVNSANEATAVTSLINRGYIVLSLETIAEKKIKRIMTLRLLDIMTFSRQLATMIEAGVNLANALATLAEQEVFSPKFRKIVTSVLSNIEAGMSFSEALDNEKAFDDLFVNLIEAGETSGTLAETLEKVASFYESQKRLKDEIKSATSYPVFVMGFSVIMVIAILAFVLPKLVEAFGGEAEGIMAILMQASNFLRGNWLILLLIVVGLGIFLAYYLKTFAGKKALSYILSVIPAVKNIRRNSSLERYCRTLSVMVGAGVEILRALELASKAANDYRFEKSAQEMAERIKTGETLEQAFTEAELFPGIVIAMVGTGEKTGKLDKVLDKVGDFFEERVRTSVKQLVSMLEPAMMVVVGGFIGLIAYAMYSSMFSGQQNLSRF